MEFPRSLRLSATVRGLLIGALFGAYYYVGFLPEGHFRASLIIAAVAQFIMLVVTRLVPAGQVHLSLYVIELLADGATVLLFALAIVGATMPNPGPM